MQLERLNLSLQPQGVRVRVVDGPLRVAQYDYSPEPTASCQGSLKSRLKHHDFKLPTVHTHSDR